MLPPLRDVRTRPEVGELLRNKLVRLMTHLDTDVKRVAAEFLFVLCSESGEWGACPCLPLPSYTPTLTSALPFSAPVHQVHGLWKCRRPPGCEGPHGRGPARGPVLRGRGHRHGRVQGSQGQVCAETLTQCPHSCYHTHVKLQGEWDKGDRWVNS